MADAIRLTIEEDTGAPPGHARLRLEGVAELADARFRLRWLGAEAEHLGPQGWQNSPALLAPLAVEAEAGGVVLKVGPEVVDRMEVDARIEVALPALGVTLPGYWPDIARSPGAADERVARSTLARQTAASPPAPPSRPPPPAPRPTPPAVATPEPVPPTPRSEPAPVEPAPAQKPGPPLESQPPVTGAKRPQWWLPVAGGLLALLLIAAGAYQAGWLEWPGSDAPQPEPVAPPAPEPEPSPAPEPTRDWRAELLQYLRDTQDPAAERLHELGQGAAEAGDLETALLAFEEAMKQGHGPAILQIGRWYDPARHTAEGSPFTRANPEQAALYYQRASAAGESAADDDLATLCASEHAQEPWSAELCPPGQ